ncbi:MULTISPECIES: hypothetical protein [Sphingomonas]|uniref:hypothetical protein n=1 Tax=Sphingomonas TaxID=13687 RepID=UPI000DEFBF80|nr:MULTISPECIES: hypothetical protein [Sphingomonas]
MDTLDLMLVAPPLAAVPLAVLIAIILQQRAPELGPMKIAKRAALPGAIFVCLSHWAVWLMLPKPTSVTGPGDQPMMMAALLIVGGPVNAWIVFYICWAWARGSIWVQSFFQRR